MLKWCIEKLAEVSLDLREMKDGSSPEHQAKKVDQVISQLKKMKDDGAPDVHGSGTGGPKG